MKAGCDGRQTTFIVSDCQLTDPFLEDLNTLVNMGDIPDLFATEERSEIVEKMRQIFGNKVRNSVCTYTNIYTIILI